MGAEIDAGVEKSRDNASITSISGRASPIDKNVTD